MSNLIWPNSNNNIRLLIATCPKQIEPGFFLHLTMFHLKVGTLCLKMQRWWFSIAVTDAIMDGSCEFAQTICHGVSHVYRWTGVEIMK